MRQVEAARCTPYVQLPVSSRHALFAIPPAGLVSPLQAGGCVLYDYRLMHRGMPNTSVGTERPLVQLLYHSRAYVEKKNYGVRSLFDKT